VISFQINNEFLDMPANPSVDWQRTSPFFQFDGINLEDFTLPIAFPNTPKNKRILDFPHIIENASRLRPKWDAVLYYNGVPRAQGEIRAKSPINKDIITANFVAGLSLIGDDVKERKLSEIIDEVITIHEQTIYKAITIIFRTTEPYKLKINGNPYDEPNFGDFIAAVNADPLANYTASGVSNVVTITMDDPGEFIPFHVELDSELTAGVSLVQLLWQIDYNDAYIDFLVDHFGTDRLDKKIRFGTFGNLDQFRGSDRYYKEWPLVNYIADGELVYNRYRTQNVTGSSMQNNTSLAPMITLFAVIEAIETYYNMTIDFFAGDQDDVLFTPFTLDRPVKVFNGESLILFEREFNLNQLVPDITVNNFIKALQVGFNAQATFDPYTRVLTIGHRQPAIIARTYEDITLQVAEPSDIQLSIQKGLRFALQADTRDKVTDASISAGDYLVGEGERTIQAGFGAPAMRSHTGLSDWPTDTAQTTVWVNLPYEQKFPLKFARYVEDGDLAFLDSRPFLWLGTDGLIESYWEDSIRFEDNPVSIRTTWLMPRNEVFDTRWEKIWRIDRVDFMLKNFNVALQNNGVSSSECVFVMRPYFKDGAEPEPEETAWRVLPSSFRCVKDEDNINTGVAFYDFLEEYVVVGEALTGNTKINQVGDPDYVAPVENLAACPVPFGEYQAGELYIIMNPAIDSNEEKVRINGVEYTLRTSGPNPFPYPYAMSGTTDVQIVVASNPKTSIFVWTISVYQNADLIFTTQRTVGPNNDGPPGTEAINLTYRTINLGDSNFDILKANRIVITRQVI
jgi:hypothetical protein